MRKSLRIQSVVHRSTPTELEGIAHESRVYRPWTDGACDGCNLLKAGHELTVWNRSPEKAKDLLGRGARWADSPGRAAGGDVVMTMLADDHALETVVYGDGGILAAPALHVSHSTISVARRALGTGHGTRSGFVSAPVFGRPVAAQAAKLFVVTAGQPDLVARCEPLFAAIGQRSFHVGNSSSAANLVKLGGNFMAMAAVAAMAEAMTLVEAGGVERRAMLEVLTGTLFNAPIYHTYGELLVEDRFRPGLKDMNLADGAATASRVPMPVLGVVRDHLRAAIATEGEDIDWASIALAVRKAAGRSRPEEACGITELR